MVLANVVIKKEKEREKTDKYQITYMDNKNLLGGHFDGLYLDYNDKMVVEKIRKEIELKAVRDSYDLKLIITRGDIELDDKHARYEFLHTPRTLIYNDEKFTRFYMLLKSKYINYYKLDNSIIESENSHYGLINVKGVHYDYYYNLYLDKTDNIDNNYHDYDLSVNFHNEPYLKQKIIPFNHLNSDYYNTITKNDLFYNIKQALPFLKNKTFMGNGTEENPYISIYEVIK